MSSWSGKQPGSGESPAPDQDQIINNSGISSLIGSLDALAQSARKAERRTGSKQG
jgi:hypothetical protein